MFKELLEEYKFDIIVIIYHYIVSSVVSRKFKNDDGYLIENKFGYLKQAKCTQFNSASFVMFSGNQKGCNSSDLKLIEKLSWIDEQTGNYVRYILKIQKKNKIIGEFLKFICLYGLTDKEIGEKLNIAERTIRKYKVRAYYHLLYL